MRGCSRLLICSSRIGDIVLEDNIKNMLADLKLHKRDKANLLEVFIEKRLNASLKAYYDEIMQSYNSLLNKDNLRAMKKIIRDV